MDASEQLWLAQKICPEIDEGVLNQAIMDLLRIKAGEFGQS